MITFRDIRTVLSDAGPDAKGSQDHAIRRRCPHVAPLCVTGHAEWIDINKKREWCGEERQRQSAEWREETEAERNVRGEVMEGRTGGG